MLGTHQNHRSRQKSQTSANFHLSLCLFAGPGMAGERFGNLGKLLPLPSADWASVRPVMADFADTTALSKRLFRALKQPVRQNGHCVSSVVPLFCAEAALSFWTEHSKRNWLNSHLAVIGVPQCERDFIGRWRITSSQMKISDWHSVW